MSQTELVKIADSSLAQRTRAVAELTEGELRRFAVEAARDWDVSALWILTEAHLSLHSSLGSWVSSHTLSAYRRTVGVLLDDC